MWHPFKKKAHERQTRAENDVAQGLEQSFAAAESIADKGERLLALERIRQDAIDRVWWLESEKQRIAQRKYQKPANAITSAGFIAGVAVPFVVPGLALPWLVYFATVGGCLGTGLGVGKHARKKFLAENEMRNRPIRERLIALSLRADDAIEDMVTAHLPEIGKSPHFTEVLARMPQAREAFAKVAAALPDKSAQQPPPQPPTGPGKGLNL